MKKVILILAVAGIFILSLSSCASTCKGGMCPSWSHKEVKSIDLETQDFRFLDRIISVSNQYKNNEDLLRV